MDSRACSDKAHLERSDWIPGWAAFFFYAHRLGFVNGTDRSVFTFKLTFKVEFVDTVSDLTGELEEG